ncbi:hypothetical protein L596_012790 [Steinernema carpocapsae]|uniref:Tyrosine-protein phosphatase domain-containing protein n=1 Tax=Steinernema carpocapsae TaxID=34508 RepID=A0A4U5NYB2_STECR|nr:hypothetical protein L596_012790 [Steinernema carpocapsae]
MIALSTRRVGSSCGRRLQQGDFAFLLLQESVDGRSRDEMATTALTALKKYRRPHNGGTNDADKQDSSRNSSSTRTQRKKKTGNNNAANKKKSEKDPGILGTNTTMTVKNDQSSQRKRRKGKNTVPKKSATPAADAGNTMMGPAPGALQPCSPPGLSPSSPGSPVVHSPMSPVSPPANAFICWDLALIIPELLNSGRIDLCTNEEIRSAMRQFAKNAAQIGAGGALAEYTNSLKLYVPENTTRLAFDANMDKNRYQDVICADKERVQLVDRPNLTDYIHANRVIGKPLPSNHVLICTQGPFQTTTSEFWRMVDSIVMLCETKECGKDKCAQYWPLSQGETLNIPVVDYAISNKGIYTHEPGLITTVLCLRDATGAEQRVLHHQWKLWPDKGVPERTDVTLKLLQLTRPSASDPRQCTVVHCSAGIAALEDRKVELCAQRLLGGKPADILSLVKHLRTKRMHSIQTDQQYLFVYKVLLALVREHVNDPETMQAIDTYNVSYEVIVKGGASPVTSAPSPAAAFPAPNSTPLDPFANAPSPFAPTDYATIPPLPAVINQNQNSDAQNSVRDNNFFSY